MTVATGSRLSSASSIVGAGPNASISVGGVDCRDAPGLHAVCRAPESYAAPVSARGEPPTAGRRHGRGVQGMPSRRDPPGCAGRGWVGGSGGFREPEPESRHREHPSFVSRMHGCTACPKTGNLTIDCTPTELKLPPGFMVRASVQIRAQPIPNSVSRALIISRRGGLRSHGGQRSLRLVPVPQRDGLLGISMLQRSCEDRS